MGLWLLGSLAWQVVGATADWPQWRGPTRDGVLPDAGPWPSSLQEGELVRRWRVPMGPSYSGPLLVGDRVYTTESKDQSHEVVLALDRQEGRELWRASWEGHVKVPFFAKSNGDWIRATPAYSQGKLYVGGMRDVLVCLDAASGRELWRLDFPRELKSAVPSFGLVSSPCVVGDAVYVQAGGGFARVEAATGKLVWRTLEDGGGMWGSAFSSPVLATLQGEEQFLVQTRDKLAGVKRTDGSVLWTQSIKAFRGMNILTPVVLGDRVLTASYGGQTQGWSLSGEEGARRLKEEWALKVEGYMTSPVLVDGYAYFLSRAQRFLCVEVATGRKAWESEQKFGKYLSLVARGKQLLALDERGILFLFAADPARFGVLAERKIADSETWAHLAISGNDLAIRELDGLSLWRWGAAEHADHSVPAPAIAMATFADPGLGTAAKSPTEK
ncbi:MAG: PQQ-like beta-propeller repeat protein [Verrucomicrobiales bacterium]|nr:PQQ-like beta-propeller repeat protein [Verrucomicrobiales bacterium]